MGFVCAGRSRSILHQNFLRRNAALPPGAHLHPNLPPYVTEKANEPIGPLEKSLEALLAIGFESQVESTGFSGAMSRVSCRDRVATS